MERKKYITFKRMEIRFNCRSGSQKSGKVISLMGWEKKKTNLKLYSGQKVSFKNWEFATLLKEILKNILQAEVT